MDFSSVCFPVSSGQASSACSQADSWAGCLACLFSAETASVGDAEVTFLMTIKGMAAGDWYRFSYQRAGERLCLQIRTLLWQICLMQNFFHHPGSLHFDFECKQYTFHVKKSTSIEHRVPSFLQ